MSDAFNARFVSTFSPDRQYRVYIDRGEIFFIRIGGQGGVAVGITSQFGLLGALVQRALKKRGAMKLAIKTSELDRQHPSTHLSGHKHNFHTTATTVESSSLEPAPLIGAHGQHFGRWKLKLRESKEMLFQFETIDDMKAAYQLLPSLGRTHTNNVVWDPIKLKFTKVAARLETVG